jgi:hypothetical protein
METTITVSNPFSEEGTVEVTLNVMFNGIINEEGVKSVFVQAVGTKELP